MKIDNVKNEWVNISENLRFGNCNVGFGLRKITIDIYVDDEKKVVLGASAGEIVGDKIVINEEHPKFNLKLVIGSFHEGNAKGFSIYAKLKGDD